MGMKDFLLKGFPQDLEFRRNNSKKREDKALVTSRHEIASMHLGNVPFSSNINPSVIYLQTLTGMVGAV